MHRLLGRSISFVCNPYSSAALALPFSKNTAAHKSSILDRESQHRYGMKRLGLFSKPAMEFPGIDSIFWDIG
jgi:hypothetical protein